MESFSQMADRWIEQNLPEQRVLADAKKAKEAKKGQPGDLASHDHAAWQDDFCVWIAERCSFRDRVFWSVRHLYGLFCSWCLTTDRVPCRLDTFESLLTHEDFLLADGLIYGLVPSTEVPGVAEQQSPGMSTGQKGRGMRNQKSTGRETRV